MMSILFYKQHEPHQLFSSITALQLQERDRSTTRGVARGPKQGERKSEAGKFLKSRGRDIYFHIDRVAKKP